MHPPLIQFQFIYFNCLYNTNYLVNSNIKEIKLNQPVRGDESVKCFVTNNFNQDGKCKNIHMYIYIYIDIADY